MNILSVICILILVLYLMVALVFTKKNEGRRLFRMVYSSITLGLLCTVFYFVFESIMGDFSEYIDPSKNIMRNAYAYFMLLIPVNVGVVFTGLCLKKKRPALLLIISSVLSVVSAAAILIYSFAADQNTSNAFGTLLEFAALYLPFLFYFSVSGLLSSDKKWERVLHNVAMYLNLAIMIGYLILIGAAEYALFAALGISSLIPFIPVILVWILIPVIPILVYNYFRNKDAIRKGETLPGKLRISIRKKKSKGNE